MAKEVRIELTAAQKAKIKAATGKTLSEIRVSSLGKNLAVHAKSLRSTAARVSADSTRIVSPTARVTRAGAPAPRVATLRSLRDV